MPITWIVGNTGAGKTTLARKLMHGDRFAILLDGDVMRTIWTDLGFTKEDRFEQSLRVARLAKELDSQGYNIYIAVICAYKELRGMVKKITRCRFIYLDGGEIPNDEYVFEVPDLY